ncbi:SigE family RNA polymerase sigma factor [Embleya sp. NPDC001921]
MTVAEFEEFYRHSVRSLVGQIHLLNGDLQEAQDVVQEAFVRAWTRRAGLNVDGTPEAWVRTVAWRLAVSRWRKRRRATEAWRRHDGRAPAAAVPGPETVDLVAALRRLSDRQRWTAVLYYVCDLSVDQVAAETGISAGAVKTHLSRARAALGPYLMDDLISPEDRSA